MLRPHLTATLALLLVVLAPAAPAATMFRAASHLEPAPLWGWYVDAADIDGDGRPEIVGSTGAVPDSIVIWRLHGPGVPATVTSIAVRTPFEVINGEGDVNGDGREDLVTAFGDSISIYLGRPDGTLEGHGLLAGNGDGANLGDAVGDGASDVVVSHYSTHALEILPGHIGGAIEASLGSFPTIQHPDNVQIVDWNGDGRNDLVVHGSEAARFGLHLALASGGFAPVDSFAKPANGIFEDVDGDGVFDLLAESGLYPGLGGGAFGALIPAQMSVRGAADFDGDGRLDLFGIQGGNHGELRVQRAHGDGSFEPALPGPAAPAAVQVGAIEAFDANGDSHPDVVALTYDKRALAIYDGSGNGRFETPPRVVTASDPYAVRLVDLDEDGRLDALVTATGANALEWRPGLGGGQLGAPTLIPALVDTRDLRCADLDGDGDSDVVAAAHSAGSFSVWRNDPGLLSSRTDVNVGSALTNLWLIEASGDARPDVLAGVGSDVVRFTNDGSGGFGPSSAMGIGGALDLAAADLDHDGDLDLVSLTSTALRMHRRSGPGSFDPPVSVSFSSQAAAPALALADFDGDGWIDAAAYDGRLASFRGQVGGSFAAPVTNPRRIAVLGPVSGRLLAADLDGDGPIDLLTSVGGMGAAAVWRGRGDASFEPDAVFGLVNTGASADVDLGDLDGDSRPDAVVMASRPATSGELGVLLNNAAVVAAPVPPLPGSRLRLILAANPIADRVRGAILGAGGMVELDLIDVSGRRVRHARLDGADATPRSFDLGARAGLPPGRYVLLARQAGERTSTPVVVLR